MPAKKIREWEGVTKEIFKKEIIPMGEPAVFRGFVKDWAMVKKSKESDRAVSHYIKSFDRGEPASTLRAAPDINGKFFYKDDMQGLNFEQKQETLSESLDEIFKHLNDDEPPAVFTGSVAINNCLPGLHRQLPNSLLSSSVAPLIWLGNRVTVQTHYDPYSNIACVGAGRRRFTLFPPSQIHNLYVGPIDFTPAGQPVSMVKLHDPDFIKYPRFEEALAAAEFAELEPGDAIYIPELWWHHVESLEAFNVLVNYWWVNDRVGPDAPYTCMMHGLMSIRTLPKPARLAWRELFDHYVFRVNEDAVDHLDVKNRGILGKVTPQNYNNIKKQFVGLFQRDQPKK
jgi:hypothetical protein